MRKRDIQYIRQGFTLSDMNQNPYRWLEWSMQNWSTIRDMANDSHPIVLKAFNHREAWHRRTKLNLKGRG